MNIKRPVAVAKRVRKPHAVTVLSPSAMVFFVQREREPRKFHAGI